MNWQKINWPVIVIGIIVTFAAISSSYFFWQQYAVTKPVTQGVGEIAGVEKVVIDSKNQLIPKVHVTLTNVDNLEAAYQSINDTLTGSLGSSKYKLILHDHRTPELEQLYYTIHYYVYEGISTGKFSVMSEKIQEKAAAANTKAHVYIDANNVYLQLTTTNGDLYQIIPREPDSKGVR